MQEFLVRDYTNCKDPKDHKIRVVSLKELFDEIDAAKMDVSIEIIVHEIGDCLLDWS